MADALPSSIVASITFTGRSGGAVKSLGGFRKKHHRVPDLVNATTNAFLGKICAEELTERAEKMFQEVRVGLGYKRKDLSLEITGATALLSAKDFSVEISYALTDGNPDTYDIVESMRELLSAELAQTEAFARIFTGRFTEMSFALRKGAKVEAVIDAIESLDPAQGLRVEYQSDCSECTISVNEVDAVVRCTGGSLDMVFPRAGSPRELIAAFAAVRSSFAVSRVLAGLIER